MNKNKKGWLTLKGVLFGGTANNGTNCGFSYANSNNVPSNTNTNIGSRTCFKIIIKEIKRVTTLPLGKKYTINPKGAGRLTYFKLSNAPIKKQRLMKRIGNLYEKIISIDNLKIADEKARKGKLKSYGVKLHDQNKESNIQKLHEALLNKTFKTSEYFIFKIYEPKEREIYRLPYYPDRIVHHAIMNILEPIWTKVFTYNTYSCIKERGIEGCAKRVDSILKKYEGRDLYCLKIDIKKFYPSIDHDVAKSIIRKKIKDKDLLALLDDIIDSAKGLPIGNYLSQFIANLVLAYFMHYVNEVLKIDSTEYADDICFFADNKQQLNEIFPIIKNYLTNELKLEIKGNYQIFRIAENRYDKNGRALDYVGYKFYRKQKLLRKSIKKNFCRKAAKINKKSPTLPAKDYKQLIAPWLGWAQHSNSKNLLHKIIKKEYYESIIRQRTTKI